MVTEIRPDAIGRTAVAAAIGAWDEKPEQDLRLIEMLMKSWSLQTIEQVVPAANATPPPDFSALFPAVLSLADSGDRIARDVLTQAGTQLANLAGVLLRRLFPHAGAVPVALSGGAPCGALLGASDVPTWSSIPR